MWMYTGLSMLLLRKVFNFTCEKQVVIRNHVLIKSTAGVQVPIFPLLRYKKYSNPYFESDCINNEKLIPWNAVCSESCLHGVDRGERLERV